MKEFLRRFLKSVAILVVVSVSVYLIAQGAMAFDKWNLHWTIKIALLIGLIAAFCSFLPAYREERPEKK